MIDLEYELDLSIKWKNPLALVEGKCQKHCLDKIQSVPETARGWDPDCDISPESESIDYR
jgi:hypothetical protein